jgi:hypothetical protein
MPSIENVAYSQAETITAVRDYYHFLVKMYMDEANIVEPPDGGWPNITTESMKRINKTDEVIQLLRHLPYIELAAHDGKLVHATPWTVFISWNNEAEEISKQSDSEINIDHTQGCLENIPPR